VTGKGVVISAKHHPWRKVFRINPDLTHRFSIFIHLSHIWNDAKINNSLNDFGINICNHYCCFLLAEYSSSIVHYGLGWRVTGKGVVISAKDHPWGKVFRIHPDLTHRFSIFIHLSHIWNDAKINNSLNDFGINICNHYCCFLLAEYSSSIVNFCCIKTKYKLISLHISIYICTGWPAGPTFPTFPYFLIQSPTFPYFLKNSPTIPTFWGVMLSN